MAEHNQGGHGDADSPYSNSHAGRPKSWLAVIVVIIGFCVSGFAMCVGPAWTMFWIGAAVIAVGGIFALVVDIWNDVVVDPPRVAPENMQHTALGGALKPRKPELATSTED